MEKEGLQKRKGGYPKRKFTGSGGKRGNFCRRQGKKVKRNSKKKNLWETRLLTPGAQGIVQKNTDSKKGGGKIKKEKLSSCAGPRGITREGTVLGRKGFRKVKRGNEDMGSLKRALISFTRVALTSWDISEKKHGRVRENANKRERGGFEKKSSQKRDLQKDLASSKGRRLGVVCVKELRKNGGRGASFEKTTHLKRKEPKWKGTKRQILKIK